MSPRERIVAALEAQAYSGSRIVHGILGLKEAIAIIERELPKTDRVALLEAENAELRRDRERLEFMSRTQAFVSIEGGLPIKYQVTWSDPCERDTDWHDDFRDAIDEAMRVNDEILSF